MIYPPAAERRTDMNIEGRAVQKINLNYLIKKLKYVINIFHGNVNREKIK